MTYAAEQEVARLPRLSSGTLVSSRLTRRAIVVQATNKLIVGSDKG